MGKVLINGVKAEYVSVMDRAVHYGDGLFETIACIDARPVFIEQHLQRMESGAHKLNIPFPGRQFFLDDIHCLLGEENTSRVIKLILTRGQGRRGYRYDSKQSPTRVCMLSEWPDYVFRWQEQGIKSRFCTTQVSLNPGLAGIKSLNRLDNVMASGELATGFDEGFLSDIDGNVIEGTMSNVFEVCEDYLVTPDLTRGGVKGVIRDQIIDIAHKHSISLQIRNITREELLQAQEVFVSNSIIGICGVKQLEQHIFSTNRMANRINTVLQKRIEADANKAA